jgi:hypothetical protein
VGVSRFECPALFLFTVIPNKCQIGILQVYGFYFNYKEKKGVKFFMLPITPSVWAVLKKYPTLGPCLEGRVFREHPSPRAIQ